jgi:glycosyltransferase involved in cell wall biosynthesis
VRLLLLAPYPPYPPRSGGALRIYNLLRGLAQRHEVWCLSFAPDAAALRALEPLRQQCHLATVQGPPPRSLLRRAWTTLASPHPDLVLRNAAPAYAAALRRLLQTGYFDVVQAESIEMAPFGLLAAGQARLVLDEFNAEYVLQRRAALGDLRRLLRQRRAWLAAPYSLVQWRKLAHYERHVLRHYDCVLTVSEEDRRALLRLERRAQMALVPNGVDTDVFAPGAVPEAVRPGCIVFTGTLDYRPNVDAALWFVREVLPLIREQQPAAHLLLVGRSPAPAVRALHDGAAVRVLPDVPDVRPFIAAAAAYVVPMRIGGGVRLKLLEALAMQAAVVSTRMGAEGLPDLRGDEHLLLADTPRTFAAATLRLLDDAALRQRLGAAGRTLARRYDWRAIVPRLEQVYQP